MRRGFLNKTVPKTPSRGDAKVTLTVIDIHVSEKLDTEPVIIPRTPTSPPDIPTVGVFPTERFRFNMVTFPLAGEGAKVLCLLYPKAREQILALPGFPSALPELATSIEIQLPYSIVPISDMHRGIIANVALNPGDPIMCERPLLLYPVMLPHDPRTDFYTGMVEQLHPMSRALFYRLHNCKGTGAGNVKGIVDTNAIHIGKLPGSYQGSYAVLGVQMSLFNHSCGPNAERQWDLTAMAFHVRALRPIAKGEQIFIAYCDPMQTWAARQTELLSKYSFTCVCATCILPKVDSIRSDVRRNILRMASDWFRDTPDFREDENALKKWAADPTLTDDHVYKHSQLLLRLMEEEGAYVEDLWFAHCEVICKALCALENRADLADLAKKAAIMATAYTGNDCGWNRVAAAPEKTAWWGLRRKSTK